VNATLVDALPQLEEQLTEARVEARAAQERVDALEQVIGGIRRLNGRAEAITLNETNGDAKVFVDAPAVLGPRGRAAVLAVVAERPGVWRLKDLAGEVIRRGWSESPKGVEVAVHRLTRSGEARRVGIGVYEFPAAHANGEVQE
jgi:hypothetical protein